MILPHAQRNLLLAKPCIRLVGHVDEAMYKVFRDQLGACPSEGPLSLAISTTGGDPEIARTMGDDIRLLREQDDRTFLFLGKVAVYSAGATLMSGFPIADRFLTEGTRIMIHERSLERTLNLSGPLHGSRTKVRQLLKEIDESIVIEEEGFRAFVEGSKVDFEKVRSEAKTSWYIDCHEAKAFGLIAGII